MTYRAPGKKAAVEDEKPSVVIAMDIMLSFRDTWRDPLDNFSFDVLMEAKTLAAQQAAAKLAETAAASFKPLETHENGFKVIDKTKLSEDQRLVREAQLSLNQLAEENFDAVVPPLLQPMLFQERIAAQIVDRIFEKCIDEPKFAPLYARMCVALAAYENDFLDKGVRFKKALVEKVQTLFEEEPVRLERKVSQDELAAARKRKMANSQLVAQLLIANVLGKKVFAAILDQVFIQKQHPQELDVEVTAQLIETVCCATPGEIAKATGKAELAANSFVKERLLPKVIERFDLLKDEERLCRRVVFKLMEVLDHNKRGWQPRPGTQPKSAAARLAQQNEQGPMTPATADAVSVGSTTTSGGGPQFPREPPASSLSAVAAPGGRGAAPPRRPEISSSVKLKFVSALKTAIPAQTAPFQQTLKDISVLLPNFTVPINRMAAVSIFADAVAKSSDADFHADAAQVLSASGAFEPAELLIGFQWSIIEGTRDCVREDCPKFYERLAALFAEAVLKGKGDVVPFVALVRDVFQPVAERIIEQVAADKESNKELDEEMMAEDFVHSWESFIRKCTSLVLKRGGGGGAGENAEGGTAASSSTAVATLPGSAWEKLGKAKQQQQQQQQVAPAAAAASPTAAAGKVVATPKFAEMAECWAKVPWSGMMAEIALPDVVGQFLESECYTAEEMREWADANAKNPKVAAVVAVCNLVC